VPRAFVSTFLDWFHASVDVEHVIASRPQSNDSPINSLSLVCIVSYRCCSAPTPSIFSLGTEVGLESARLSTDTIAVEEGVLRMTEMGNVVRLLKLEHARLTKQVEGISAALVAFGNLIEMAGVEVERFLLPGARELPPHH
jgi:hypothetical protein